MTFLYIERRKIDKVATHSEVLSKFGATAQASADQ